MKLRIDPRARAILRRIPTTNVYTIAELVLLAGLALQTARLVWVVATPVSPLGDWRPAEPTVPGVPADILGGFDPFFRISGAQTGPAVVTSLSLKLFGTRINEATGLGSAIIAGPDGVQKSFAVGEEVAAGAILKAVAFDHVTIERGGIPEDLFLDQSGVAPASPPGSATLPAPVAPSSSVPPLAQAGVTAQQLQADTGFIPRLEDGRISGLVVRSQGTGKAFRAAGLRNGDLVTSIAGRPISGQGDLDQISADYAEGGTLAITVNRNGQTLALSVPMARQ